MVQFKFDDVTVGDVADYFSDSAKMMLRKPLAVLRRMLVETDDLPADLADLPFKQINVIRREFAQVVRNSKGEADDRWSFDVEMITGADVEDFMQAMFLHRFSVQVILMGKYLVGKPSDIELTDLSFEHFLGVRSAFMDGIANLGKN